jgi:hypothetical protein
MASLVVAENHEKPEITDLRNHQQWLLQTAGGTPD